jgi:hypothetical protein
MRAQKAGRFKSEISSRTDAITSADRLAAFAGRSPAR